jgi:hypothetical protein
MPHSIFNIHDENQNHHTEDFVERTGPLVCRLPTQTMTYPQGCFGGTTTDDLFKQHLSWKVLKQMKVEVRLF